MRETGRRNVHIHYEQNEKPYHKTVADLVAKFVHTREAHIIDVGCGLGHTLSRIKRLLPDSSLIAADIDAKCLDATSRKVELTRKVLIRSPEELFDQHAAYDAVIMSHVLEHTLNPVETVKGLMGVIRPGGILVLAVPNPVRPGVFLAAIRRRHYVNRGHVFAWDRSHWVNFLENILGLEVLCYASDFIEMPFLKRWAAFVRIGEFLAEYFPWLSFSNIAVIRKPAVQISK